MLARWIATVAALLLVCAQAGAHVRTESVVGVADLADVTAPLGELAQQSKTAPPARASLGELAPGENPPVTHCHVWQKSFSAKKSTSDTTLWRWDSAPFGDTAANENPTVGLPSFTFNLRFPGQQFDRETGTHYNYFRDYEAQAGRYVQSDPIGLAGGLATYAYAASSPLLNFDSDGLVRRPTAQQNYRSGKNFEKRFEDYLLKTKCTGCRVESQRYFRTSRGGRFLDFVVYDPRGKPIAGYECKQGNARYGRIQRRKDVEIRRTYGIPVRLVRGR